MKTRVLKNWKTTVLGMVVLFIGTIALFCGKVSGMEFIGFVTTAIPLIVAKDSLLEGLSGGAAKVEAKE